MSARENVGMTAVLALAILAAFALVLAAALFFLGATLARPPWLALAGVAPLIIALDLAARRWRNRSASAFGEPEAVARLVRGRARGLRALRSLLAGCAVMLLAVACARPQWGYVEEEIQQRGVDVVICVDTSKSMLADDVKPSRLARARAEISSFVDRLPGDRIAIIAFAGEARILCPLTSDHAAVKLFLDVLDPDVLDRPGTAIGSALDLARKSFPKESERHSVVLLITDGEDNAGHAVESATELAEAGVIVHVVGIGSPAGSPIRIVEDTPSGQKAEYLRDADGNTVISRLDVDTLQKIGDVTHGSFYQASSTGLELTAIAGAIAQMEQRDFGTRKARLRPDRYAWFVALALALLCVEAFLPDGARLRLPAALERTMRAVRRQAPGRAPGRRIA